MMITRMDDMAQPLALGETTPSRFRRSAMDLKPRPAPPVYQPKMRRITSTRSGVLGNRRTCSRSEPLTRWPRLTVRTGLPSGSRISFWPSSVLRTIWKSSPFWSK
ncbi:MAG: hypothetical protein ABIK96_12745 [bacterium]